MSHLFSPYALGPLELANRIAIAPMCQYSATGGLAADWHMIHYGHLALSGAGLLILEATAISPEGRISPADLGLWSAEHQQALAPVVQAIRRHSPIRLAVQLAHAGRKASSAPPFEGGQALAPEQGGWQTVAPSALPHAVTDPVPQALDDAGLAKVKADFVSAALRVHALGIEAVELHGAHGYLLHQFLSPLANQRSDQYGGSLENRMRFPLEVFNAVRAALPREMAVGMRVSASDWVDGGWDIEQSVALQQIPLGPGYQIQFAQRIKAETGMPTIGVGLITEPLHAEAIIASGQADMVGLARAMLYNPRWPWHAAAALGAQVAAPPQYWRCQPREMKNLFGDTRLGQR
jgi:2,4-dienoyl-CoA reductase-like NADH-dependent reductase (Old Yellow Enzyme family)